MVLRYHGLQDGKLFGWEASGGKTGPRRTTTLRDHGLQYGGILTGGNVAALLDLAGA